MTQALVRGAAEIAYQRLTEVTTGDLLATAFMKVTDENDLDGSAVDGLGVASFTLRPDRSVDLAWKLGLKLNWMMDDTNGGVSAINMLQHAIAAIETRQARNIVLLAADAFRNEDFSALIDGYNETALTYLSPLRIATPNALFAMLTKKPMARHGLVKRDYGALVIGQRRWAETNPLAVYRTPLTMEDYLAAPMVSDPLVIYDCVPVVSGANAILVSDALCFDSRRSGVRVKSLLCNYNPDNQLGDGLSTGLKNIADRLFASASVARDDLDLACVYDDYPVMSLVQLEDLGLIDCATIQQFLWQRVFEERRAINTSGGQLSVGQAGAAGGMHGLVEAIVQLSKKAGLRQLPRADHALVSGYGMVQYRYGMCANAAILQAA